MRLAHVIRIVFTAFAMFFGAPQVAKACLSEARIIPSIALDADLVVLGKVSSLENIEDAQFGLGLGRYSTVRLIVSKILHGQLPLKYDHSLAEIEFTSANLNGRGLPETIADPDRSFLAVLHWPFGRLATERGPLPELIMLPDTKHMTLYQRHCGQPYIFETSSSVAVEIIDLLQKD